MFMHTVIHVHADIMDNRFLFLIINCIHVEDVDHPDSSLVSIMSCSFKKLLNPMLAQLFRHACSNYCGAGTLCIRSL